MGALGTEEVAEASAMDLGPCPWCVHDYTAACPKFWKQSSAGTCYAPSSYRGPCQTARTVLYTLAMSDHDKADVETRCLVCWPCTGVTKMSNGTGSYPDGPVAP